MLGEKQWDKCQVSGLTSRDSFKKRWKRSKKKKIKRSHCRSMNKEDSTNHSDFKRSMDEPARKRWNKNKVDISIMMQILQQQQQQLLLQSQPECPHHPVIFKKFISAQYNINAK
uniref:Uncharacterized protein n=1 Tax=Plectus sambesii TaxID=2011161 RepID=A0A914W4P2_9BILA